MLDFFIDLAEAPDIKGDEDLRNQRDKVLKLLKEKTFHQIPDMSMPCEDVLEFRTIDRAQYGSDIYSFISEEGWRLLLDGEIERMKSVF